MLTAIAAIIAILFGVRAGFLPPMPAPVKVSVLKHGEWQGQFALLMVTTLQRLLLNGRMPGAGQPLGAMQMMAIEGTRGVLFRALVRSEEHTSELQSLMRISYAVFCLIHKTPHITPRHHTS